MKTEKQYMLKHLGARFKFFREEKGFSRKEASNFIGVTERTLAAYERGEREISIDTTEKMAQAYGVTFELLTDYKYIYSEIQKSIRESDRNIEGALL